jgi:hypothetical protein
MNADRITTALVSTDLAEFRGDLARLPASQLAVVENSLLRLHTGDATADAALASILDRTVRMPIYRWDDAQRSFATLARKAIARKLPVPAIEEVSRETIGEGDNAETWLTARILGGAPVLDGWSCLATLTRRTTVELIRDALRRNEDVLCGTLLTLVCKIVSEDVQKDGSSLWIVEHTASATRLEVTTEELVAHQSVFDEHVVVHKSRFAPVVTRVVADTMRCDHCNMNRKRDLVFVLRHEDGREVQVGSSCLNDYLGTDALGAWFVWSRLHELTDGMSSSVWSIAAHAQWLADQPEVVTRKTGSAQVNIGIVDYLAACIVEIRCMGYMSRTQVREIQNSNSNFTERFAAQATGDKVWHAYQTAQHIAPCPNDFVQAEEIVKWSETLDRDQYNRDTMELTYISNLARHFDSAMRSGVHEREANMLASAVGAYDRELARRAQDAVWTNSWFEGNEGDAVVIDATVRRNLGWALACADSQGRQILVRKHEYKTGGDIEIGDTVRISGSIGGLNTFRGVKQTFISRPSVYRPTDKLSPGIVKKAAAMFERLGQELPAWAQPKTRARKK